MVKGSNSLKTCAPTGRCCETETETELFPGTPDDGATCDDVARGTMPCVLGEQCIKNKEKQGYFRVREGKGKGRRKQGNRKERKEKRKEKKKKNKKGVCTFVRRVCVTGNRIGSLLFNAARPLVSNSTIV